MRIIRGCGCEYSVHLYSTAWILTTPQLRKMPQVRVTLYGEAEELGLNSSSCVNSQRNFTYTDPKKSLLTLLWHKNTRRLASWNTSIVDYLHPGPFASLTTCIMDHLHRGLLASSTTCILGHLHRGATCILDYLNLHYLHPGLLASWTTCILGLLAS